MRNARRFKHKDKRSACQAHAQRRARQRFGVTVGYAELDDIVFQIQRGKAEHIRAQSNRVSVWRVALREEKVLVVYDRSRKVIVTILPKEAT